MATKLIELRRGEPISKDGVLDNRTSIYLEENTKQTNESTELTEYDPSTINLSSSEQSSLKKQINEINNQLPLNESVLIPKILKLINDIENNIVSTSNGKILNKIEELELLVQPSSTGTSDLEAYKRAVRLFMGPIISSSDKYVARTTSNFIDGNSNIDEDLLDLDTILNNVRLTFGAAVDSLIVYVARAGTNFINGNSDIDEDFLDLDAQIKTNQDNITTNATNISTNTTNIGTNATNISNNASDITSLQGKFSSGSWTPTLEGSTTAGTPTYVTQTGSHNVVDGVVEAYFDVVISTNTGMVGNLKIAGLPFSQADNNGIGWIQIIERVTFPAGTVTASLKGDGTTATKAIFEFYGSGIAKANVNVSSLNVGGNTRITGIFRFRK